jgi:glycosyltransferase involved in cell wall biosynthesis
VSAPTISVIVPAMNEAANLPHVLPRIPSDVLEVILVDGNSTDDTVAVARAVLPSVRVVKQHGRGKGAALRTGFAAARGDIIVMLDADGSTAPEEIPAFVRALMDGADFAKGSRFLPGGGTADMQLYRKLGNATFVTMVRLLFGGGYTDLCYGYNAFWRQVVARLGLDGDGFEIETMMNVRALKIGLRVVEVPSFEAHRIHGESNLHTIPDGMRVLRTIIRERFSGAVRAVPPMPTPIVMLPVTGGPVTVPVARHGETDLGWSDPAWVENGSSSAEVLVAR